MTQKPNGKARVDDAESMLMKRRTIFQEALEIVGNTIASRREWQRAMNDDPRRDLPTECGWPTDTRAVTPQDYQDKYDGDAIAARVVELLPKETWRACPTIYERDEGAEPTAFENDIDNLNRRIRGTQSWYDDQEGSALMEYFQRADIQAGIGTFGLILTGYNDGLALDQPVRGLTEYGTMPAEAKPEADYKTPDYTGNVYRMVVNTYYDTDSGGRDPSTGWGDDGSVKPLEPPENQPGPMKQTKPLRVNYLRVFPESMVQVIRWESNPTSPRFQQPTAYSITVHDPKDQAGIGMPMSVLTVHWSRVIHIPSDNMGSSEIFGPPRQRAVWTNILDIKKTSGASNEGYYKSCFAGISFETHPQLGGDVKINEGKLKDMWEEYQNGLQRALFLMGMTAKQLAPSVVDPTPFINAQIELIAIRFGCPVRIFKGSERGELASSQDDDEWKDRINHRRMYYVTPKIIVPFFDRLIMLGAISKPERFKVWWPGLHNLSEGDKAAIGVQRTTALINYISGNGSSHITFRDFLVFWMEMDEDDADAVIANLAAEREGGLTTPTPTEPDDAQDGDTEGTTEPAAETETETQVGEGAPLAGSY